MLIGKHLISDEASELIELILVVIGDEVRDLSSEKQREYLDYLSSIEYNISKNGIEINNKNILLYNLGRLYFELGDYNKAKRYFEEIIETNKDQASSEVARKARYELSCGIYKAGLI